MTIKEKILINKDSLTFTERLVKNLFVSSDVLFILKGMYFLVSLSFEEFLSQATFESVDFKGLPECFFDEVGILPVKLFVIPCSIN